MKKIILVIFLCILILPVFAQANNPSDDAKGFYFCPYAGYSFGVKNGVNTGIYAGYRFYSRICLEAEGAYCIRREADEYKAAFNLLYDMHLDHRLFITIGVGGGSFFGQSTKAVPFMGFRFSFGGDVYKNLLSIGLNYNSGILFGDIKDLGDMGYTHGVSIGLRFLFDARN